MEISGPGLPESVFWVDLAGRGRSGDGVQFHDQSDVRDHGGVPALNVCCVKFTWLRELFETGKEGGELAAVEEVGLDFAAFGAVGMGAGLTGLGGAYGACGPAGGGELVVAVVLDAV